MSYSAFPRTIDELIVECQQRATTMPQNLVFAYICDFCRRHGIKYYYYMHSDELVSMILCRQKNTKLQKNAADIQYQCNGVIINCVNWTILVRPPLAPKHHMQTQAIDKFIATNKCDIIEINDGTIVTLYCCELPSSEPLPAAEGESAAAEPPEVTTSPPSRWCIATYNAYDISKKFWVGELTYAEVIYDLITRLYPSFAEQAGIGLTDSRLTFKNLPRTRSYTFGFRHHNFHPIVSDPERIWLVQSHENGTTPVEFGPEWQCFEKQVSVQMKSVIDCMEGPAKYGYIIQSTAHKFRYLVETEHLIQVKRIIYGNIQTEETRSIERVVLQAYLTPKYKAFVQEYLGNWAPRLAQYTALLEKIAAIAFEKVQCLGEKNDSYSAEIIKAFNIQPGQTIEVIRDYITNPKFWHIYMSLIDHV